MLTMRYLLAYYSGTASQWRCLDTDLLPQRLGSAEDLPAALESAPMITLTWMLERQAFGGYQAAGAGHSDASVMVYELDPAAASPLGNGTDYVGVWLEMFMQTHEPIGSIAVDAEMPMPKDVGFGALRQLATTPLQASDAVCQQTMDRMRDYAPTTAMSLEGLPESKEQETA